MKLFHYSSTPDIKIFEPRFNCRLNKSIVWAIDEEHSVNYLFPRNLPRICIRDNDKALESDRKEYFNNGKKTVIIVASQSKEFLEKAVIYKYSFDAGSFELNDKTAGYYVSYKDVIPLKVEKVDNLPSRISQCGAELRYSEDLFALRKDILNSSIRHFSMIKLN